MDQCFETCNVGAIAGEHSLYWFVVSLYCSLLLLFILINTSTNKILFSFVRDDEAGMVEKIATDVSLRLNDIC